MKIAFKILKIPFYIVMLAACAVLLLVAVAKDMAFEEK